MGTAFTLDDTPIIKLVDIKKTFFTGGDLAIEVLHGISLEIHAGEFVAIMGASGSGKTTLMNIIGCLDRPTEGQYCFAGQDVAEFDRDQLAQLRREAFGFIFQSYHLIATATAAENVEVPAIYAGVMAEERHVRAVELLASLGLADRLDHRPNQLSGGEQQRVSIARALMNGGKIILADEPTGALDSQSGAELMQHLHDLSNQGHTIILITHDNEIAQHADRLIEIRDGMIINDSVPARQSLPADQLPQIEIAEDDKYTASLVGEAGESMRMALRSLRANLFRTVLTLLGIMIGVAAVIAMLALGEGAKQAVLERIGSMGTNLLLVRPGAPNVRTYGPDTTIATLVPADAKALTELANVQYAVPEANSGVTVRYGNRDVQTQVTATMPDYIITRSWPVAKGTFFNDDDVQSYATVVVVGQTVASNLFGEYTEPVGQIGRASCRERV